MYNSRRMDHSAKKSKFLSFSGIIINISNEDNKGCTQRFQLEDADNTVNNFTVTPNTYFIDNKKAALGMPMTAFYDASLPVTLIYPPQFTAVAASLSPDKNVKIDMFNQNLVSKDGSLRLNLSPVTEIILTNGQTFHGDIRNRELIVVYGGASKSIPASTIPMQIIVLC